MSKKANREAGNTCNKTINFYKFGKSICQLTYEHACTASDTILNDILVGLNECMNTMKLVDGTLSYIKYQYHLDLNEIYF